MSHTNETFFTSIGCMDGRVQKPVAEFGREKFNAQYPDTITEAGLVGFLFKDSIDPTLLDSLKKKIFISIEKHHSKGIIVHGHQECAALDAVDDETHKKNILKAAEVIRYFVPSSVYVVPVFVTRSGEEWKVEPL